MSGALAMGAVTQPSYHPWSRGWHCIDKMPPGGCGNPLCLGPLGVGRCGMSWVCRYLCHGAAGIHYVVRDSGGLGGPMEMVPPDIRRALGLGHTTPPRPTPTRRTRIGRVLRAHFISGRLQFTAIAYLTTASRLGFWTPPPLFWLEVDTHHL